MCIRDRFFTVDLEKSFLNTEEFPVIKRCVKHCNSEVREADKLIYGDAQTSYEKAISR